MKYSNEGKEARDDSPEPGPGHSTMLTTPSNSMHPSPSNIPSEGAQASVVARYGVVVEVALNHAAQPLADHRDRLVLVRRFNVCRNSLRVARIRFAMVSRFTVNRPFARLVAQMCVNPKKSKT